MDLISVVVPVYNVEKYLEKCIYSIINQRYKNLEIILVDDGSTDSSGKICDTLAKEDSRIKVYHKQNGGLSDARNYGVKLANGKYIGFVDSDDWIHEDMYFHLYETIKKDDSELAECNFTFVYNTQTKLQYEDDYHIKLDKKGYLKEYLKMEKLYGATCCRLIKSEIAKKIYFPVGKIYEDVYYTLDLLKLVENYVITSKPYYYYYIRENSITNEKFNNRQLNIIEIISQFKEYTYYNYPELINEANSREMYAYFSIINQIVKLNDFKNNEYYNFIIKYFRKNLFKIIKNPIITKNRKLATILICINIKVYKKVLYKYVEELNK